jgi:hypothetical protein
MPRRSSGGQQSASSANTPPTIKHSTACGSSLTGSTAGTDIEYWKTDFRNGVLLRFADDDQNTLQSTSFSDGTIVLAVGMSSTTGQRSWSVSRQTTVEVQRNNAMSLDNCMADVGHLDALTTILFGRPTSATHIRVQAGGQHRLSGASLQLIGVIAPGRYAEPERRIHPPSDSLCTFEQFGELNGLANWFSLHEDFRYLAGRVASHHRAEGRFIEDRALTAFSAGEALDRTATGYSQSSARTRWKRLANAVPEFVTEYLDLPVDAWAHALVEWRDDLSHALSLGPRSTTARRHLEGLTASAHLLSVLTLFRLAELGARISPMAGNRRWRDEKDAFAYLTDGLVGQ